MKKYLLWILTIFGVINCDAQIINDSIDLPVLKGDIILYGSSRNGICRRDGYNLKEFSMLGCGSGEEIDKKSKISSLENHDSTLTIKISIKNNCCKNYLAEIEIIEDTILNILYHDYGFSCLCDCNFCLTYKIEYSPDRIRQVSRWKKVDMNLKYAMINSNRRTLENIESHIKIK